MSSEEGRGKHYNSKWEKGHWKEGNSKGLGGQLLLTVQYLSQLKEFLVPQFDIPHEEFS